VTRGITADGEKLTLLHIYGKDIWVKLKVQVTPLCI